MLITRSVRPMQHSKRFTLPRTVLQRYLPARREVRAITACLYVLVSGKGVSWRRRLRPSPPNSLTHAQYIPLILLVEYYYLLAWQCRFCYFSVCPSRLTFRFRPPSFSGGLGSCIDTFTRTLISAVVVFQTHRRGLHRLIIFCQRPRWVRNDRDIKQIMACSARLCRTWFDRSLRAIRYIHVGRFVMACPRMSSPKPRIVSRVFH